MRLIIDSKNTRVEISNIGKLYDNGCDLEVYSDPTCPDPMEILIGGYWGIAYGRYFTLEKSHLQCVDAIYLVPDELRIDEEAESNEDIL